MFKTVIRQTPLTSEVAEHFFQDRITGDSWVGDYTFLTTLRALLDPRMPEEDRLKLVFRSSSYSKDDLGSTKPKELLMITVGNVNSQDSRSTIAVHEFKSIKDEDNAANLDLVNDGFEKTFKGWKRVEKVSTFFKKVFNVSCYVNPTMKSVVLFTERMDSRRQHYLQCGIPAFFPWYFDPKDGISEIELKLISSLREKTSETYDACVVEMAKKYDFRAAQIKRLLRGFESKYERIQCDSQKRTLNNIISQINDLDRRIGDFLEQKRMVETTILGLETKIANGTEESELMEYFLCNKHLELESVEGSNIVFVVKAQAEYFDEDMAKRSIENDRSYFYCSYGDRRTGTITHQEMRKLMTEIFLTQRLHINFCAAYSFRIEGNVSPRRGYNFGIECSEYIPNPHVDRYECLGNYSRTINKLLSEHNYIGAIEQCIASCKSLNFGDSAVMNAFSAWMYGNSEGRNTRCIVLPDGRVVTPREAVDFLNAEEKAAETAVAETAADAPVSE